MSLTSKKLTPNLTPSCSTRSQEMRNSKKRMMMMLNIKKPNFLSQNSSPRKEDSRKFLMSDQQ